MADIDYYEVLGVEKPNAADEKGEKEDETADRPDETDVNEGEKERPTAEDAVDDDDDVDEDDDSDEGEDEDEQSDEDNARYAAIRRKAEAEAAEKAARERDRAIADLGYTDEEGNPITTLDELTRYKQRESKKKADAEYEEEMERLLDYGMSEKEAEEIIENRRAAAEYKAVKSQLDEARARQQQAEFDRRVEEELEMIREYDPSIKTIADLSKMDNFEAFKANVASGDNYITAFLRSHRGASHAGARDSGKGHLRSTSTRGGSGKTIPESVYAEYLMFNPDATRKEIREHYLRNHRD